MLPLFPSLSLSLSLLRGDVRSNPTLFSRPSETNELAASIAAAEESQEGMQIVETGRREMD